jgi:hypothetical protein
VCEKKEGEGEKWRGRVGCARESERRGRKERKGKREREVGWGRGKEKEKKMKKERDSETCVQLWVVGRRKCYLLLANRVLTRENGRLHFILKPRLLLITLGPHYIKIISFDN